MTAHEQAAKLPEWFADTEAFRALPKAGRELLIGLDIDGTLIHHDTSASERVIRAYHDHVDAGTRILPVTGRGIAGAQVAMKDLKIDECYAICSNGASIVHVGPAPADGIDPVFGPVTPVPDAAKEDWADVQLIAVHTFDPTREIQILAEGLPGALMAVESATHLRRLNAPFPPGELSGEYEIVPLDELAVPNATRLTVRVPSMTPEEMLARVSELGLNGVEYAVGWTAWLDVVPEGISKAGALDHVREVFGVTHTHTVAVGDSGNDVDMLAWAALGVAMGNAPDYVKAHANAVTEHVDNDGVALILEALLR